MKKIFTIYISTEHKSFLLSLCAVLEKKFNHEVRIIARDKNVKKFIKKFRNFSDKDIVFNDIILNLDENEIINKAYEIERKYKFNFAMAILEDRGLGQGYLFNVDKHPHIGKSDWPHEKKIKLILENFLKFENLLDETDVYIGRWANKLVSSIMDYKKKKYFCLASVRLGDRRFWSDDNFLTSSLLLKSMNHIKKQDLSKYKDVEYKVDKYTEKVNKELKFNYIGAIQEAIGVFYRNSKRLVRGSIKKDSYGYLGWLPSAFRRVHNYKLIKKIGKKPQDLSDFDIAYFTLHLEPEVSTLSFTPEFNNSMEIISNISKSLPSKCVLVVKEHVHSYGVRSSNYYKQIQKIGNVFWSYPDIDSFEWLEKAKIVAALTGTVGYEAVYFNKPVLSFGKHQLINHLDTVFYCNSYFDCVKAINKIYYEPFDKNDFDNSKKVLTKTQLDNSFELEGHAETKKSDGLVEEIAEISLDNLFANYSNEI